MHHCWLPRRGQSLVEFALIAPLLFALMFILVELGIIFSIYIGLTNSAREAVRVGSVYQYPNPELLKGVVLATARDTVDDARADYMDTVIENTLHPLIDATAAGLDPSVGDRYTYDPVDYPDAFRYGSKLTVSLEYQHNLFFNLLGSATITLKAQSTMRLEPGGL